jgi:tripartite-type tricarboxylate transporter receptor subunit TctC
VVPDSKGKRMNTRFDALVAVLVSGGVLSLQPATGAPAQPFPSKTVRYLMPQTPGSAADTIGRIIAEGLTQVFGQPVIVDNRTGAAGNIGAEIAARAPADGYTIVQVSLTHAVNATLYRNLSYDLLRDFSPVTQLASAPSIVLVHSSLPVKSLPELVKLAKARPGGINYASAGSGSATFFSTELFKIQAGIDLLHVPYRGGGEALNSILAGETSVYFAPVATSLPHVRAGRVRGLAVTTAKRLPLLADYPTVAETGFAGYESGSWYGLMVPLKTPRETVTIIRNAAIMVLNKPEVSRRLIDLGYVLIGDEPAEFAAHIKSEIAKLGKIVQQTGATGY